MFSLPSSTAPAALSRRTTSASSVGMRSLNTALAAVVRIPAVSIRSLSASGMPCKGPRQCPCWICASASLACCNACSAVTVMNALSAGFKRSIRAMKACTSSTGETALRRSIVMASSNVSRVRSLGGAGFNDDALNGPDAHSHRHGNAADTRSIPIAVPNPRFGKASGGRSGRHCGQR